MLKTATNASRLLAYKEIGERASRASNVELMAHILPFVSTPAFDSSFEVVCKDEKFFEIVKQLFQFATNSSVSSCLEVAVERKMESQVKLLLSRGKQEGLVKVPHLPEFEKLDDGIQEAIENRIKHFPTEIAIELAFLPKDKYEARRSLKGESGEYNAKLKKSKAGLACKDQQSCVDMLERMDSSARVFPVERATSWLLGEKKMAQHWKGCCLLSLPMLAWESYSFLSTKVKKLQKPVLEKH